MENCHSDWYEQALMTEARIKAFFSANVAGRRKLIVQAVAREAALTNNDVPVNNMIDEIECLKKIFRE